MPLKPIPVKMKRAERPEIAMRAMAVERDVHGHKAGMARRRLYRRYWGISRN